MSRLMIYRPHEIERGPEPSVWARALATLRSFRIPPISLKDPLIAEKLEWTTANASSGVAVSEETALTYAAVWAAVSLISATVASLPLKLYKRLPNGGKEPFTTHKTYQLLHDEPNSEMTSMVFRETLQAHVLTWGNAYAEIERNGGGAPVALWPLPPNRVSPVRRGGALRYEVINADGRVVTIDPINMLHVPGLGFNGTYGYSVIAMARESLGLGLAAERFGATFFGNGSTFGGYLEHPETLGEEAGKSLRASMEAMHQGPSRAHRIMLLEEGMKFKESSGIPPNDAQFLETRVHQIQEVARWFRIQPHKLGELTHATFSNIEHQAIEFVTDTIRPWLVRWEQEINRKLISPLERRQQFVEHLVDGLLRGDINSRYGAYAVGRTWGWLCADDVRERENMNPLPDGQGQIFLVPQNHVPANRVNELIDSQIKKNEPVQSPAPIEPDADSDAGRAAVAASVGRAVQLLESEIPALRRAADEAQARAEEAARMAAGATTQVADHQTAAEAARAQADAAQRELGEKIALLALAHEERDRERMRAEGAEVARAALDAELAARREELDAAAQREAAARAQAEEAEQNRAEAESACEARTADLEAARADVVRAHEEIARAGEQVAAAMVGETTALETAAQREAAAMAHVQEAERVRADVQTALEARTAALEAARADAVRAEQALIAIREQLADAEAKVVAAVDAVSEAERRASEREAASFRALSEATDRLAASEHALLERTAELDAACERGCEAEEAIARAAEREAAAVEAAATAERRAASAAERESAATLAHREAVERLASSEQALGERSAELDVARERVRETEEIVTQAAAREAEAAAAAEAAERRTADAVERESAAADAHSELSQRLSASEQALADRTAELDAARGRVHDAEEALARASELARGDNEARLATIVRAETALEIVRAELAERTDQHAAQVATVASLTRELDAKSAEHQAARDAVMRLESEREDAKRQADETARLLDDANGQLATRAAELTAARTAEAEAVARAETLSVDAEQLVAEVVAARAQAAAAEQARAELEAQRDAAREAEARTVERLADLSSRRSTASAAAIAAHRELYVDAMRRMIDKEADRLTAAQANRDKLRAAAKSLYERHEQTVCDALVSAMRIHLATVGSTDDPAELARDLAQQHVESARADVARLLEEDGEYFHTELAQMLRRWRETRVGVIANHLIQREIDYVSRNQ